MPSTIKFMAKFTATAALSYVSVPAFVAVNAATAVAYGLKEASTSERTFELERIHSGPENMTVIAVAGFCTKKAGHAEETWKQLHLVGASKVLLHWEAKRFNDLYGIPSPTGAGVLVAMWHEAKRNARRAGQELASRLRSGNQFKGPVSLIGHSLGARVIFHALKSLAESGHTRLVRNAIFLGGALPACPVEFAEAQRAVMGHLVNVFSPDDNVLCMGYRTLCAQWDVAGIQPVETPGVINIDATALLSGDNGGHMYADQLDKVMHCIQAVLVEMGHTKRRDDDGPGHAERSVTDNAWEPTEMKEFQPAPSKISSRITLRRDASTKVWTAGLR